VRFVMPKRFPFFALAATRAFYWMADRDGVQAKRFAQSVYDAAFARSLDVTGVEAVLALAAEVGMNRANLAEALESPEIKERLKTEVDAALARGVFGSPFVIVDGEPFWGNDRLDEIDRWLATGGW
jgi:2-hydroxychromene-2-carboxylate isomerase